MAFFNNRKISFVRQPHHQRKIIKSQTFSRSRRAGMPMYIPASGPGCGACGRH